MSSSPVQFIQQDAHASTKENDRANVGQHYVEKHLSLENLQLSLGTGVLSGSSIWLQRKIRLRPVLKGCHLVTDEVLKQIPELSKFFVGMCNIHLLHTSASLVINENWDPDVREDVEAFLCYLVPESTKFRHLCEGPDDMPAHIKACFMGQSLTIPISDGKLNLGNWQGLWLCEHREKAGSRKAIVTINGLLKDNFKILKAE